MPVRDAQCSTSLLSTSGGSKASDSGSGMGMSRGPRPRPPVSTACDGGCMAPGASSNSHSEMSLPSCTRGGGAVTARAALAASAMRPRGGLAPYLLLPRKGLSSSDVGGSGQVRAWLLAGSCRYVVTVYSIGAVKRRCDVSRSVCTFPSLSM